MLYRKSLPLPAGTAIMAVNREHLSHSSLSTMKRQRNQKVGQVRNALSHTHEHIDVSDAKKPTALPLLIKDSPEGINAETPFKSPVAGQDFMLINQPGIPMANQQYRN